MTQLLSAILAGTGSGARAALVRGLLLRTEVTGTTLDVGDEDAGTLYFCINSSDLLVTLSRAATPKTDVIFERQGAGAVVFATESGAPDLVNISGHTGIVTNGTVAVRCLSNADGNSAVWKMTGETE